MYHFSRTNIPSFLVLAMAYFATNIPSILVLAMAYFALRIMVTLLRGTLQLEKTLPAPSFTYRRGLKSLTECVGFGFDPITNDYKVVRIVEIFEDDDYYRYECTKAQIYNLSTDSWREINAVVPDISHFHCFEPFLNGSFHWSASYFVGDGDSVDDKDFILSFHMSTEVFQKMGFPYVCSIGDGKYRSLGVLNESLALILYDYSAVETKNFDIWVMTEYGVSESWTKQFTIGPLSGVPCPLSIWKNNELLLEASNGQLVSCNLKTQDIKEYEICGVQTTLRGSCLQ
ncbi:unnamed protein product [Ilex paraguariensis]|uniref:F-box associated beta-propeller type 1 domain-containing protein n=1 Tax=Ilex paraguariensis TaxID=185542 RepID=A0ABC8QU41_9AQUA